MEVFQRVKNRIPRGELWISGEIFKGLALEIKQESLITLNKILDADMCFFSYSSPLQNIPAGSGEMSLLIEKARASGLICGVTVDGPFERLVRDYGFMEVIKWFHRPGRLVELLKKNAALAAAELRAADNAGADFLILCDDIAYNRGLYFSPDHFRSLLLPLYRELRNYIRNHKPVGFHSDGNIESVIDDLIDGGFSIFSLEPEAMDLGKICRRLPGDAFILSGIKAAWLMEPDPNNSKDREIVAYISDLKQGCRLILASACGLYDLQSLERLKRIYRLVESC